MHAYHCDKSARIYMHRSLKISRGALRSRRIPSRGRAGEGGRERAQVARNEAKMVGETKGGYYRGEGENLYGGKSLPGACNYRSDRYANG